MKALRFAALCAVLSALAGCASVRDTVLPPTSMTLTTEGTQQTVVLKTMCGFAKLADCTNTTVFDCSSGRCERQVRPKVFDKVVKKEGGGS